jgi:tetratricopeptide (TPR) repeat protein
MTGDRAGAERVWLRLLDRIPNDRPTHARLGRLYALEGREGPARDEFEKSLPDGTGFEGLIAWHRRHGDLIDFSNRFHELVERNSYDPSSLGLYAIVLRAQERFAEAQVYYDRIVTLVPHACGPLVDAGSNELEQGNYVLALRDLDACLALDPAYYPALVDESKAHLNEGDAASARSFIDRALEVRPNGMEALVGEGVLEDRAGKWEAATNDYIHAMSLEPMRVEPYVYLGFEYAEHGLYDRAESMLLKGLNIAPADGKLHYFLAETYRLQDKIGLALSHYELAAHSDDPEAARAARAQIQLIKRV